MEDKGKNSSYSYYHKIFIFCIFFQFLSLVYVFSNIVWIPFCLLVFLSSTQFTSANPLPSLHFLQSGIYPLLQWYIHDLCLKISTWYSPAMVTDTGRDICSLRISVMPWGFCGLLGKTHMLSHWPWTCCHLPSHRT